MISAAARTFPPLLDAVAREFGDKIFLHRRNAQGGDPVTFKELHANVRRLASGLLAHGIERGDRIALIAENRYEWILADLATVYIGAVDVPRGSDTAPAELLQILAHSGARFAFAESQKTADEIQRLKPKLPDLQTICVLTDAESLGRFMKEPDAKALAEAGNRVTPDDLLTIVYTSGTTSEPKGVMLSHNNVLSNLRALRDVLHFGPEDLFLSVLPAWHMYERIMDYAAMCSGASLVYTDRRRIKDDLRSVRPTAFAAVPRIWEMLHDGIVNHVHKLEGAKRALLTHALSASRKVGGGKASLLDRAAHAVYARTLLPKFRAATGGRLRIAVSGGGSLPAHVDETLLGLGIPILNGYGLTETSPVASLRVPESNRAGVIGLPLPGTKIEVRDEKGNVLPNGSTGVIWIHGPQVMKGYYKNEERTRAVLDARGFFNSGDLGRIEPDGQVRITGRAKDTIVLVSGENVEPEPLEIALKSTPLIEQAVVVGQDQRALGALLVPSFEMLEQRVPRASWEPRDGELHAPALTALVREQLDRLLSRENGFRPIERVRAFALLQEPMTVENGLLTPTMKVKRHVVQERYASTIQRLFAGGNEAGS